MTMTLLLYLAISYCAAAFLFAMINLFPRTRYLDWTVNAMLCMASVSLSAHMILRWVEAGRPPFSNMFESLIVFAWAIVLIFLAIRLLLRMPVIGAAVLGTATTLMATVILVYASSFESTIEPLFPALRSNWLTFHVLTCFFGYAFFAISFVAAVIFLIMNTKPAYTSGTPGSLTTGRTLNHVASGSLPYED